MRWCRIGPDKWRSTDGKLVIDHEGMYYVLRDSETQLTLASGFTLEDVKTKVRKTS